MRIRSRAGRTVLLTANLAVAAKLALTARLALAACLALATACEDGGPSPPVVPARGAGAQDPRASEAPLSPEDVERMRQAARSVQEDRFEDTERLLGPLLARSAPPADALFIAGSADYEIGDYAEAVTRLTDAIRLKPDFIRNSSALGFAQFKLGDFAGARASFERIVESNDGSYKAHYGLGLVALSEGRLTDARSHIERSLGLSPGYLKARFQMARLLQEEGRLPESADALEAVLEAWPTHEEALYRLAQVQQALGRGEEAAALVARHALVYRVRETIGGLTQRIRSGDDAPALHAEIARLWLEVGDGEEASRALAAGLRRFPEDARLQAMATSLRQSGAKPSAPDGPAPVPLPDANAAGSTGDAAAGVVPGAAPR